MFAFAEFSELKRRWAVTEGAAQEGWEKGLGEGLGGGMGETELAV